MAELVFFKKGEELMHVSLERAQTVLGRGGRSDVSIPDPSVSRVHATIERRGSRYFLIRPAPADPPSEGEPAGTVLEDGEKISLGDWHAVFRASSSGERATNPGKVRLDGTQVKEGSTQPPISVRVQIRVVSNQGERIIPFDSGEMSIGKDDENLLVVEDPFVSSFHARLVRNPRGFWLRDLGSTNGTFVDGKKFGEGEVALGSRVRVGETDLCLEARSAEEPDQGFDGVITHNPRMIQLFELIDRVAPTNAQVLILGETGTGKELVARAIHARSTRRNKPWVALNCAAISHELLESELFGHEKGAFTGAIKDRAGSFVEASGGTLFLDEIGEMPLPMQAKLLRSLESGEIKRVGSSKAIQVDVRIVAATHRNLSSEVLAGRFREDLLYRLNVFPLTLPPLRSRAGDIPYLAQHFIRANGSLGAGAEITSAARQKLEGHRFPGNVRELRNVIFRALLLGKPGRPIDADQIQFDEPAGTDAPGRLDDEEHLYLPGRTAEECAREVMIRAVRRHGGNRSLAAKELDVSRSTVSKYAAAGARASGDGEPDGDGDED